MSVTAKLENGEQDYVIYVSGRFDFNSYQAFKEAYSKAESGASRIVVDLSGSVYLDSSALGMLLQLKSYADGNRQETLIRGCNANIRNLFEMSHFRSLFTIESAATQASELCID